MGEGLFDWSARDGHESELSKAGVATNQGFAGVYDFRKWRQYPGYLPGFASCLVEPRGILVVHPGREADWRRQEYYTLKEFAFPSGSLNRFEERPTRTEPNHRTGGTPTRAIPFLDRRAWGHLFLPQPPERDGKRRVGACRS